MDLDEIIKNAICNDDLTYLDNNTNVLFSVNHRFKDEDNDTLLHYALSNIGSTVYTFLLNKNPDFNATNDDGETLLHSIVFSGDPKRIELLMQKEKIDINKQTNDGTTALLLSALLQEVEIFDYLISVGADVNIFDNEGISPLHIASQEGYTDMVITLVNNNADLFAKTHKGNLPLALAVNNGHSEVVKYLYEKMGW